MTDPEAGQAARLRAMLDSSPAGVLVIDAGGHYVEANAAFADLVGRGADELASTTFKALVHPEDLHEVMRLQAAIASGTAEAGRAEVQVFRAGGGFAWTLVTLTALRDEAAEAVHTVAHFIDITERKERELRLALLERALNAAHAGVIICDARQKDFPIVAVNRAWEQITGYTQEEALGRNARFLRGDNPDEEQIARLREGLRDAAEFTVKLTNQHKDGHPIWVELSVSPVRAGDGKVSHFVGVMQDLGYRRAADLAIKRAEERFQLATAAIEGAVYDREWATGVVEWTEGLQRVFGFPAGTRVTENDWYDERIHPDDRERVRAAIDAAVADGARMYSVDYRWQRHDGEYREVWDKGVIQRDEAGAPTRVVGTVGDVTERVLARRARAGAEAAEKSALSLVPFYIDTVEPPVRTLYLSPAAAELLGVTREAWQADPTGYLRAVVAPEDRDDYGRSVEQRGAGDDHEAEYRVRLPDGSDRWIHDRVSIARDVEGRPLFAQGVLTDITERKRPLPGSDAAEDGDESPSESTTNAPVPLFDDDRRRESAADLLGQIEARLARCRSLADAGTAIDGLANRLFPNLAGALYATNGEQTELVTAWNGGEALPPRFAAEDCHGLRLNAPYGGDPSQAPACNHIPEPHPPASLCLPLPASQGPLGVLYLGENSDGALTPEAREDAGRFAATLAAALSAAPAAPSTPGPAVVGGTLQNRADAEEWLAEQLARIGQDRGSLAVVMVDIDNLRRLNADLGHRAGDTAVREVTGLVLRGVREHELAARFGDDEFMLVFLEVTAEAARQRAEALRVAIKRLHVPGADQPGAVTASFGLAVCPDNGLARDVLIRAARAALLRAKRDGRDNVASAYNAGGIGRTS